MKNIYIVGSINTDLVITSPYMPKSGETLTGSGFFSAHGGKGANQAVAAARLGGNVKFCGCVGDDVFGQESIESFKKEGIDVSHIRVCQNTPTGTAVIIIVDGDNRIILDAGANAKLTKEDIDSFLLDAKSGDIYLTQLECPIEVIGYGLQKAKEKGLYVVLNPAPANKAINPFIQYVDLLTPNESETELFGGKEALLNNNLTLLITLGSKGFSIIEKNQENTFPCIKIKPVDTTAAGDTLCGGLVAHYSKGFTLEESAKFGSLAASIACTRKGAQPSIPSEIEVLNYK